MNLREIAEAATVQITNERPPVPLGTGNGGPITRPTDGRPNFPDNMMQAHEEIGNVSEITQWFHQQDDKIDALCEMLRTEVHSWNAKEESALALDDWTTQDIHDEILRITFKHIKGLIGEVYWANELRSQGKTVLDLRENDEKRGIDLRTTEKTYQIKTTQNIGDEQVDKDVADVVVVVEINENFEVSEVEVRE